MTGVFPPSDVPGAQSLLSCASTMILWIIVFICINPGKEKKKKEKHRKFYMGWCFYGEDLGVMLMIASHILLARARAPTPQSPRAEKGWEILTSSLSRKMMK